MSNAAAISPVHARNMYLKADRWVTHLQARGGRYTDPGVIANLMEHRWNELAADFGENVPSAATLAVIVAMLQKTADPFAGLPS